jgi:hypothetical protein
MSFEKGHEKTGGRQKGTPNKKVDWVRVTTILDAELATIHKYLSEARQDIEFYRGKVERLELALMSNPPAQQAYVETQAVQRSVDAKPRQTKPQVPPRIPFSDLKRQWMTMTAEDQEKAMKDGWDVEKKEETNAG